MNIDSILQTEERLSKVIRKTHLIKSSIYDKCNLYLKPENLQITGSFKIRGSYNKIMKLSKEDANKGVIACSAGNHAQGVALASKQLGIKAVVCMPSNAPQVKIDSTRNLGAEVVLVDGVYDDAYEKALELPQQYGYTFVHPFNDEDVMEGQGTIAVEILKELPETDVILTAVGGGGLISGVAYAAKTIKPSIKVYGVQSTGAPGMYASVANGYITKLKKVNTFADGIAVKEVANLTFDYTSKYVDDIFTVSDVDILNAIKMMMNKEKIIAEGAGGAPVAAVLNNLVPNITKDTNVVCVVSGGNIDIPMLSKIVLEGLD